LKAALGRGPRVQGVLVLEEVLDGLTIHGGEGVTGQHLHIDAAAHDGPTFVHLEDGGEEPVGVEGIAEVRPGEDVTVVERAEQAKQRPRGLGLLGGRLLGEVGELLLELSVDLIAPLLDETEEAAG